MRLLLIPLALHLLTSPASADDNAEQTPLRREGCTTLVEPNGNGQGDLVHRGCCDAPKRGRDDREQFVDQLYIWTQVGRTDG